MGRPYPSHGASSHNGHRAAEESPGRQRISRPRNNSTAAAPNFLSNESETSYHDGIREDLVGEDEDFQNQFNGTARLDFHMSATTENEQLKIPRSDHYARRASSGIRQINQLEERGALKFDDQNRDMNLMEGDGLYGRTVAGNETSLNNDDVLGFHCSPTSRKIQMRYLQTDSFNHKESPRIPRQHQTEAIPLSLFDEDPMDEFPWQTTSSKEPSMLPGTSIRNSSSSTSVNKWFRGLPSQASEYDCATIALSMLQQLNQLEMERRRYSEISLDESGAATLDSLIDTASKAIKRLSGILACSCSQKTEVGLLAAAVSASILDLYGTLFRSSTIQRSSTVVLVNNVGSGAITEQASQESPREASNEVVTTIRILAELPRVANLVREFSKRYPSQEAEEGSADVLSALATDMNSKLKVMISETTNWLARV